MVFLKWFNVDRQQLIGQGKVFVNKAWKIADLVPLIQEKMGWDNSVPIKLFEVSSISPQKQAKVRADGALGDQGGYD